MTRSFGRAAASLSLGQGQTFRGEAMLALCKASLQAGVSYIAAGEGTPLLQLLQESRAPGGALAQLDVQLAPLGQVAVVLNPSLSYQQRGLVFCQGAGGARQAADALSDVAATGIRGGALIVLDQEQAEGTAASPERCHALAMQAQAWLLDPRPELAAIVDLAEQGFRLSEASHTPLLLQLRHRVARRVGSFGCKDNRAPKFSQKKPGPPASWPPAVRPPEMRLAAALKFIREQKMNEFFDGGCGQVGIVVQGGLYNAAIRALQELRLADAFGKTTIPLYVLNVCYPLVTEEVTRFCSGKRAVLVLEQGRPAYIEEALNAILRRADMNDCYILGKEVLPQAGDNAGDYSGDVLPQGIARFLQLSVPDGVDLRQVAQLADALTRHQQNAANLLAATLPQRPPGLCLTCPQRTVFAALKTMQARLGNIYLGSGHACRTLSALSPFGLEKLAPGYGFDSFAPDTGQSEVSIIADDGSGRQQLLASIAAAAQRHVDHVLLVMRHGRACGSQAGGATDLSVLLPALGVPCLRRVRADDFAGVSAALRLALDSGQPGLKAIVVDGNCAPAQPRSSAIRYWIDAELGGSARTHLQLSACPALTLKQHTDPLREAPLVGVDASCVGCGTCAAAAQAARLPAAFYKTEVTRGAGRFRLWLDRLQSSIVAGLQRNS